jgi:hypothetical protein
VTVDLNQPSMTSTGSREHLRILKRTNGPSSQYLGGGFSPTGDSLYAMEGGTGYVLDPQALQPVMGMMPVVVPLPNGTRESFFQVAPSGSLAIYGVSQPVPQIYFIDLPSFHVLGMCSPPDAAFITNSYHQGFKFDPASAFAYGMRPESDNNTMQDGVFRLDLARYACDTIVPRTLSNGLHPYAGAVPGELPGTLVVADMMLGTGLANVDPQSPSQGTFITPLTGPGVQGGYNELFWGPGYRYLYGMSGVLHRWVPFSQNPIEVVPNYQGTGIGQNEALQSADRRWLVSKDQFVDLEAGVGVWAEGDIQLNAVAAAHPTKNVFVVTVSGNGLSRFEILE